MEFRKIVEEVLVEDVMSGGEASAFGPAADQPYGDHSDARNVFYYSGVMTRKGLRKNKSKKRKKKKS